MNITRILLTTTLALLLPLASMTPVVADDTDIYLAPPSVSRNDAPNILIMIDNSAILSQSNVLLAPSYDPTNATYCDTATGTIAGTSVACFDETRTYWSHGASGGINTASFSLATTNPTALRIYSIANAYNWCEESILSLAENGEVYLVYAQYALRSGGKYRWDPPVAGAPDGDNHIDCQSDFIQATKNIQGDFIAKESAKPMGTTFDGYTTNSRRQANWADQQNATLYSGHYLNYLLWKLTVAAAPQNKSRLEVSLEAVKRIIATNININVGVMVFNRNRPTPHGGRIVFRVRKLDSTWRDALNLGFEQIRGFVIPDWDPTMNKGLGGWSFYTGVEPISSPFTESLYEAMNYFAGGKITYGGRKWVEDPTIAPAPNYNYDPLTGGFSQWVDVSGTYSGVGALTHPTGVLPYGFPLGDTMPKPQPDMCAEFDYEAYKQRQSSDPMLPDISFMCAEIFDLFDIPRTIVLAAYRDWLFKVNLASIVPPLNINYDTPFDYECQQAYIIMIVGSDPVDDTDADAAIDALSNMKPYGVATTALGGAGSCGGTTVTTSTSVTTKDTPSRLDDLAGWMHDNDLLPNKPGIQRVLTYVVNVGTTGDATGAGATMTTASAQLFEYTARAGHGKYMLSSSGSSVALDIQEAVNDIQITTSSFAAPSLSVNAFNKLYNRDEIYFALFKPNSRIGWAGNIKKLRLCNTQDMASFGCTYGDIIDSTGQPAIDPANLRIKDSSISYWSPGADGGTVTSGGTGCAIQMQTPTNRRIYTYLGSYDPGAAVNPFVPTTGMQITDDTTAAGLFYAATTKDTTIIDSSGSLGAITDATVRNNMVLSTIQWMIGYHYGDMPNTRWPFGDPLHSRPVAITLGAEADASGSGFDYNKPIIKIVASTNDGAIRILNDDTGEEEWAFIPKEALGMQYTLSQNPDGSHRYAADASPSFHVIDNNNNGVIEPLLGDKLYMYIGQRRGGRKIYAFDLTPTDVMTLKTQRINPPRLMWVIEGGVTPDFELLGQTWSTPQVRKIRVKACDPAVDATCTAGDSVAQTVLIFGGGYDTTQDNALFYSPQIDSPWGTDGMGNGIYIVDPITGKLIWRAGSDAAANLVLPEMLYSIPSDLALLDSDGDGSVDRIYTGDMGGQVWRIDLDPSLDTNTGNSKSSGFVFADLVCARTAGVRDCSTATPQDWRKIFYPPDIAQMRDPIYSPTPDYDVVVVSTGNRADPVDRDTILAAPVQQAGHNRVYALRDYQIVSSPGTTGATLTNVELVDLTSNPLASATQTTIDAATSALQASKGWYVEFIEPTAVAVEPFPTTPTVWVGEKGLAKPVIFNGVIFVTTYTPANEVTSNITCASTEGLGRIYALGLTTATGVVDLDGDGKPDRSKNVGGGIPSELVTVIREGGVTGLVGTSGGAASPNIGNNVPRGKSYWYES